MWEAATRQDRPLRPDSGARPEPDETIAPQRPDATAGNAKTADAPLPVPGFRNGAIGNGMRPRQHMPPPLAEFEPRRARMLARNQLDIEARLDLHGMRQADAHAALRRFLRHCQSRDYRHVLIITGKGASAERERDHIWGEERGVLRRLVPQWLAEPECRSLVVSYAEASARHGGQGALYVMLRRARGNR